MYEAELYVVYDEDEYMDMGADREDAIERYKDNVGGDCYRVVKIKVKLPEVVSESQLLVVSGGSVEASE